MINVQHLLSKYRINTRTNLIILIYKDGKKQILLLSFEYQINFCNYDLKIGLNYLLILVNEQLFISVEMVNLYMYLWLRQGKGTIQTSRKGLSMHMKFLPEKFNKKVKRMKREQKTHQNLHLEIGNWIKSSVDLLNVLFRSMMMSNVVMKIVQVVILNKMINIYKVKESKILLA